MATHVRQTLILTTYLRSNMTRIGTRIQAAIFPNMRVPSLWTAITSPLKPFSTASASASNAPEKPRSLPTSSFKSIEVDQPVEEEELPDYRVDQFYPVQLGEVFQNRYQIIAKLGFGTSSTSWLARDLKWVRVNQHHDAQLTYAEIISMLHWRCMCIPRSFSVNFLFIIILPAVWQKVHTKDEAISGDC